MLSTSATRSKNFMDREVRRMIGRSIVSIEELRGGFNCHIFKVIDEGGNLYLVKKYIDRLDDKTNRLLVEFKGLTFLWSHRIRDIAQPIGISKARHLAVYRFIKGSHLNKGSYTNAEVDKVISFWKRLHALTMLLSAHQLWRAKDAHFSISAHLNSIIKRLSVLTSLSGSRELHQFLEKEFIPEYRNVKVFIEKKSNSLQAILPRKFRTLSPSDFGFHNALRDKRGKLIFFDFEYFGWDDPAKMVADFFLHPKMNFPVTLRPYFFNNIRQTIAEDHEFPKRLAILYVLQSLRWCLIMLNIFLREGKESKRTLMQLGKAKKFLKKTRSELDMRPFPLSFL